MTIPTCDYDAILATDPTTWRDRGLHFHCYSWRGDGKALLDNEAGRADPANDLPPVRVRDWLGRPRLQRAAPLTPEDAATWLRAEYEQIRPQIEGDIGEAISVDDLMRMNLYDLRCGNPALVQRWLRGGSMTHLVVLAVSRSECGQHG